MNLCPACRLFRCLLIALTAALAPLMGLAQTSATVAAASDLKFAIEEVESVFSQQTGHRLRLIFGSSGNFYSQLLQGAPFDLFMSADEGFVYKLAQSGKTKDTGRLYAYGRIGVIVPKGSAIGVDSQLAGVSKALREGRLQRFAIANPEHAPYGHRAKQALQHAGIWDSIAPRLVFGENISQAAQFALSGSTQGGIIAYSLALAPQVGNLGEFALIDESLHEPLAQRMVLMRDAAPAAQAFYDFLATPKAQSIMKRWGFVMPEDSVRDKDSAQSRSASGS